MQKSLRHQRLIFLFFILLLLILHSVTVFGSTQEKLQKDEKKPLLTSLCRTSRYNEDKKIKETDSTAIIQNGWRKNGQDRFFYKKGKKVKGWNKINGKYYYFNRLTRALMKNCIAGDRSGHYYVDGTGIRVNNRIVNKAVEIVRSLTNGNQNDMAKLRKCYNYIVNDCYYRAYDDLESINKMPTYAENMFDNKCGNCYRGASALAYMAKTLGFKARVHVGLIGITKWSTLYTHGWTEIRVGDKWYICDTSMQRYYPGISLFMKLKKDYPFYLVLQHRYELKIREGKVCWTLIS